MTASASAVTSPPPARFAITEAALAIFCGSAGAASFKLLSATPSSQAILERSLLAGAILLGLTLAQSRGRFRPVSRIALLRAVLDAIAGLSFALAIFRMPLSTLTAIHLSLPIVSTVIATLMLKEQVTRRHAIGLAIGFAGIIIVVQPSAAFAPIGIGLALTSTLAYALRDALNRRLPPTSSGPQTALLSTILVGIIAAMMSGTSGWVAQPLPDLVGVALAGLFYVGSNTLIIHSLRSAPLTAVSALRYTTIVWAMLFDYLIDRHVPTAATLFGAALVIVSGFLVFRRLRAPAPADQ